jgi:hypothetical protein
MPWIHTGGVEIQLHSLSVSALGRDEWPSSSSGCFFPGKEHRQPLSRRLNGSQFRRKENLFPMPGFKLPNRPASRQVAIPTTLSLFRKWTVIVITKVSADDLRYANWKRLCWGHFQSIPNIVCMLPLHSPFPLKTLDVPQILCQICLPQSHKIAQL